MKRRTILYASSIFFGAVTAPGLLRAVQIADTVDLSQHQISLTDDNFSLLEALVEGIIPATDTPGAREVGVAGFISFVVSAAFDDQARYAFQEGLDWVQERSQIRFNNTYGVLASEQQNSILSELAISYQDESKLDQAEFFRTLKELTIIGYYTSEVGATQELRYLPVPGVFHPCKPVENGIRSHFFNLPFDRI